MNNIKRASTLVWVISCLLSTVLTGAIFLFLVDQDRWGPEDFSSGFTVSEISPNIETEHFIKTLQDVANYNGLNVYKLTPSSNNDVRSTDYYLFEGNPSETLGDLNSQFFPTFTGVYSAALYDTSALKRAQLTGTYLVQGTSAETRSITSSLQEAGGETREVSARPGYLLWVFFVIGSGWGVAIAILVLALLLALCQLQSIRLSVVAIRVSTGESKTRVQLFELLILAVPVFAPFIASKIFILSYSLLVSAGYRLLSIGAIAFQQFIVLAVLLLISRVAVILFETQQSLRELIKGKRPETILSFLSALLVVVAALRASATASYTLKQIQNYKAERQSDEVRLNQPNLVQPDWVMLCRVAKQTVSKSLWAMCSQSFKELGTAF
ncbi:hypothetical protein [Rothia sp. ZJ1223]|uniref:hypothetical protein n=1 Tax=Rothia sp. ZJ1223 TaxID=2811098 RepID=UPI00195C8314|nr:hypothetical protein [Rothia sp. ZJ1223]MBM7051653.1 hypothetical protein [Rothia sp. ZJ1223]